jgi:hypothetical protein
MPGRVMKVRVLAHGPPSSGVPPAGGGRAVRLGQRRRRDLGHQLAVVEHGDSERAALGDGADHRGVDLPALGHRQHLVDLGRFDEGHHPLLGLRHQQLGCGHARLADVDPSRGRRPCPSRPGRPVRRWRTTARPHPGPGHPPPGPARYSSRQASISFFSSKGSPTCTEGAWPSDSSSKEAEASTEAPPMPSRPVALPSSTATEPSAPAVPSTSCSRWSTPRHMTLTSGLPE